jgi:hypothetical protein
MRLVLRNTRLSQNPVNIAAGRPPRIGIGDDKRTPAGSLNISATRGRVSIPITRALVSVVRDRALSTLFITIDD